MSDDRQFEAAISRELPSAPKEAVEGSGNYKEIKAQALEALSKAGLRPESVNLWDKFRDVGRESSRMDLSSAVFKPSAEGLPAEIANKIKHDVFGATEHGFIDPPDYTTMNWTSDVRNYLKTNPERADKIAGIQEAIHLVRLNAEYKLLGWDEMGPIKEFVSLCDDMPSELKHTVQEDLESARHTVLASLAFIELDLETKPNLRAARPELAARRAEAMEIIDFRP